MKARYALAIQPQVNTAGLIGHWKLHEGSAFDYSLRGHNGTLTGTTLTYRYPGLDLEGADEHIVIADHADFTPALTPFSISAWVYMHSSSIFYIVTKGVTGTDGEWRFSTDANRKLTMFLYDESKLKSISRLYNISLLSYENQWIHVVGTYDGSALHTGIKLYLNGVRVDDTSGTDSGFVSVENLTHAVWIGRYSTSYANGLIDDLMIFNVEKSAAEVKSIYETTRGRYGV